MLNRKAQLFCAWCGVAFTVLFALGGALVGRWIPPFLNPADAPEELVRKVIEHLLQVRIGAVLIVLSIAFMAPWGAGIAARTRRKEGDFPALSYAQLTCVGSATAIALLMGFSWALMAFRPETYAPSVVQFCADLTYFLPLFSWPIFSLWCVVIALAILFDDSGYPVYPRWVAFVNLWAAVLYVPGGLILFFKHGPFAWDGIIALYVPVLAFFAWILVMAFVTIRDINAESGMPVQPR
jgi:hypothetical protein